MSRDLRQVSVCKSLSSIAFQILGPPILSEVRWAKLGDVYKSKGGALQGLWWANHSLLRKSNLNNYLSICACNA
ncbi:hypothetical protein V6Z12_A10G218200 [Gossypium hirsutum]